MDIGGVLARLPHRFPMLLVDRVEELVEGERIVALKAVTFNEPFFQGHFPGRPITVSYTHLDVYKRQVVACAGSRSPKVWRGGSP